MYLCAFLHRPNYPPLSTVHRLAPCSAPAASKPRRDSGDAHASFVAPRILAALLLSEHVDEEGDGLLYQDRWKEHHAEQKREAEAVQQLKVKSARGEGVDDKLPRLRGRFHAHEREAAINRQVGTPKRRVRGRQRRRERPSNGDTESARRALGCSTRPLGVAIG